jgi:hypothetical protein
VICGFTFPLQMQTTATQDHITSYLARAEFYNQVDLSKPAT